MKKEYLFVYQWMDPLVQARLKARRVALNKAYEARLLRLAKEEYLSNASKFMEFAEVARKNPERLRIFIEGYGGADKFISHCKEVAASYLRAVETATKGYVVYKRLVCWEPVMAHYYLK